jgi:2-polyprenyl-3-methyl-5-hydroxy-6-metoxy-1,4-benzoquinol methylase
MSQIDEQIRDALRQRVQQGDQSGYEELYVRAGFDAGRVPWATLSPNPRVAEWLNASNVQGDGGRAVVVGCGLGDDAEELARRGFRVTAFDISGTAIDWCRRRFPDSRVQYQVTDLLQLPAEWNGAFDFVLEVFTLQAMTPDHRALGIRNVAGLVAPRGSVMIICRARDEGDPLGDLPYPLLKRELDALSRFGLREQSFEDFVDDEDPPVRRFRAVYSR